MRRYTLQLGDNRELMAKMKPNTVDAIVTDPPYGLSDHSAKDVIECLLHWIAGARYEPGGGGFMGKDWDAWVPGPDVWHECFRVLKPGGHLLCFAGTRTQDLMGIALRLAGFEIRDGIDWVFGSGFPKSLDVSKAIDAAAGAEREIVGEIDRLPFGYGDRPWKNSEDARFQTVTIPATPEAAAWQGWGTALKPAHEPIIVARKPLEGTVAQNVLKWGTGAINVDGCRVEATDGVPKFTHRSEPAANAYGDGRNGSNRTGTIDTVTGRWPANLVHDGSEEVLRLFPNAGGGFGKRGQRTVGEGWATRKGDANSWRGTDETVGYGDTGSAARFFYCAKASKQDRDEGLEGFELRKVSTMNEYVHPSEGRTADKNGGPKANHHPTVKPTSLMRWLVRLVTPPGGVVLDPFAGSGSTGKAAMLEGFDFIGMELDPEYLEIARARIEFAIADQAFGLFDLPELDMAAD